MPTKVRLVKATVFPVVMYGCESWTIKKAEHRRIDTFEVWCWRRFLRVPWTARRSNQSILKEISLEYSLEGHEAETETPILWPSDAKSCSFEKTLMLGKSECRRRRGRQRIKWLDGITSSMDMLLLPLLSHFSRVQLCATPETAAHQAPLSLGFSRQKHWSVLQFPSPIHENEKWKWSRSIVSDS